MAAWHNNGTGQISTTALACCCLDWFSNNSVLIGNIGATKVILIKETFKGSKENNCEHVNIQVRVFRRFKIWYALLIKIRIVSLVTLKKSKFEGIPVSL
jgi:hypothetical protein